MAIYESAAAHDPVEAKNVALIIGALVGYAPSSVVFVRKAWELADPSVAAANDWSDVE